MTTTTISPCVLRGAADAVERPNEMPPMDWGALPRVLREAADELARMSERTERLEEALNYARQSADEEVDAILGTTSPWARGYADGMAAALAIMEGARDEDGPAVQSPFLPTTRPKSPAVP